LVDARVVVNRRGVFSLGFYESSANLDGIELIGTNSAKEDLIASLLCIEMPPAVGSYQGNRHRPVVRANIKRGAAGSLWLRFKLHLLTRLGRKCLDILFVSNRVGRRHEVFAIRAEDSYQPRHVVGRGAGNKCVYGLTRSRKGLLCSLRTMRIGVGITGLRW